MSRCVLRNSVLLETLVSTPSTIAQARAIITSVPDMCYSLIKIMADLNLLDSEVTTVCKLARFQSSLLLLALTLRTRGY